MLIAPISKADFIDREETLELLNKRVKAFKKGYRQNVALLGPEMIGKTSILSQFISRLEEDDKEILTIYIALRDEPIVHFASRFIRALLYYSLKKTKRTGEDFSLLKSEAASVCPGVVESILKIERLLEQKRAGQALGALFDLLPELGKELHRPILFILDEFQYIMSMNVKRPYLLCGEKIMSQKEVMYIITSSAVEVGKEILAHDLSLLFGNFEQVMIKTFDYKASREFLNHRLRWINIKPLHKNFLMMITGGHPFYLELLASRIRKLVQEYKVGQVPPSLVVQAIAEEVFCPHSFIYCYLERRINGLLEGPSKCGSLDILMTVAEGKKKTREIGKALRLSATAVARTLKRLTNTGLVRRCGSIYLVTEPMIALWLRLAYKKLTYSLEMDYAIYEEEFKKEVEGLINIFEEEETKTIAERVRILFSSFKNEIVKLNGHRFKLPHFSEVEHRVVKGLDLPLLARIRNRYWIPQILEKRIYEKDVREILEKLKNIHYRSTCKPLICLDGIETDARVWAQEADLVIWELEDINTLMQIFDQCPLII